MSADIRLVLHATDHTVSGEQFAIWECSSCSLRFTQDIPVENEIGRYYKSEQYISHSNITKGIVNRLYHAVRQRTMQMKKNLVIRYTGKKNGSMLDVGAGTGMFCRTMIKAGWSVTALEPDETARRLAEIAGVPIFPSPHLFELQKESLDAITLWHVLEHVHTLHEYMRQFRNISRKGGVLLIAVPNYTSIDAERYGPYWAAYDVPRHLYHFSPHSMRRLLKQHGLNLIATHPMWFDSFYVSILSEKYRTGNSNLIKGVVSGCLSNRKAMADPERCSSVIYVVQVP